MEINEIDSTPNLFTMLRLHEADLLDVTLRLDALEHHVHQSGLPLYKGFFGRIAWLLFGG